MAKKTPALLAPPAVPSPAHESPHVDRPEFDLMEFGGGGQRLATSLDVDSADGKRAFLTAQQDCDFRLVECVNQPIHVANYLVHDVELSNRETGELTPAVRLVLVDVNGKSYECVAATLLRSFQRIVYLYGRPPWNPPRVLTPKTKKKGEFSIYWFDVPE
jgi:hypothetical protein